MATLTGVILHKDQPDLLKLRLKELQDCDQIIVLDDVSKNQSELKSLCLEYSAKLVFHELDGDFSRHRNSVFPQVTSQWTLFIDCDEMLSSKLFHEIHQTIDFGDVDVLAVKRRDIFLGKKLFFGETGGNAVVRVAKTQLGAGHWRRPVHEVWDIPTNRIGVSQEILWHDSHQTVNGFLQKLNWYASLEPQSREQYSFARILFELLTFPVAKYVWAVIGKQGWRDGVHGLVHAFFMSYHSAITRVFLYEAWYGKK